MNSNLLGYLSFAIGIVVMVLTLVVIYNPFGIIALPSIVIGAGTVVSALFVIIAFSAKK